jgi:hypothetical protein
MKSAIFHNMLMREKVKRHVERVHTRKRSLVCTIEECNSPFCTKKDRTNHIRQTCLWTTELFGTILQVCFFFIFFRIFGGVVLSCVHNKIFSQFPLFSLLTLCFFRMWSVLSFFVQNGISIAFFNRAHK